MGIFRQRFQGVATRRGPGMRLEDALEVRTEVSLLVSGTNVSGEFECRECGYGVAILRELPRCPMCAGEEWQPAPWRPFTRSASTP
jgi:rubrerythrin